MSRYLWTTGLLLMVLMIDSAAARSLPNGYREEIMISGGEARIKRIKQTRYYEIRIRQDSLTEGSFAWIFYDPQHGIDIEDGGQGESAEPALLDDAWGAMFGTQLANAMLTIATTPEKPRVWGLQIARPVWNQPQQEWVIVGKRVAQLSPNLQQSYPNARLKKQLPIRRFKGLAGIVIDNASQVAHNQLGAALAISSTGSAVGPDCTLHQMSIVGVRQYVENRPDVQQASSWAGALNDRDKESIAKATTLPCVPRLNLEDAATLPANVKAVMSVLTKEKWADLTGYAGRNDINNGQPFDKENFSYINFLGTVARQPYFCGELGSYANLRDACARELAALFAHAAQETGAHAGGDEWKQAFFAIREGACWSSKINCGELYAPYKGACPLPFVCPKDEYGRNQYWGRGMKQLSHYYNYAQFSASWLGSQYFNELLAKPDAVASNAELTLGSGIWFYMAPQPPKPSMHDILVGAYHPVAAAQGVEVDATDGSVLDKFAASVSAINGAFECSPVVGSDEQKKSQNRFAYYQALLNDFKVNLTPVEQAYKPGETYCMITKGNPFVDTNLATTVNIHYDRTSRLPESNRCRVVSYGLGLPLPVAPEGFGEICRNLPEY